MSNADKNVQSLIDGIYAILTKNYNFSLHSEKFRRSLSEEISKIIDPKYVARRVTPPPVTEDELLKDREIPQSVIDSGPTQWQKQNVIPLTRPIANKKIEEKAKNHNIDKDKSKSSKKSSVKSPIKSNDNNDNKSLKNLGKSISNNK